MPAVPSSSRCRPIGQAQKYGLLWCPVSIRMDCSFLEAFSDKRLGYRHTWCPGIVVLMRTFASMPEKGRVRSASAHSVDSGCKDLVVCQRTSSVGAFEQVPACRPILLVYGRLLLLRLPRQAL